MTKFSPDAFNEVLAAYDWGEGTLTYNAYGEGHINITNLVTVSSESETKRFILQRINTDIFTDPKALMENICNVTSYLKNVIEKRGGDTERETMTVVYTKNGLPYFTDSEQGVWRVYPFVEHTICLQQCRDANDFYTSAKAFGQFQKNLSGYDASTLHETIPNFHNTPDRFRKFKEALAADVMHRAAEVAEEIAFIEAHEADCSHMTDLLAAGKIPLRVTHNDTKLNNILLDDKTSEALCIIDLDTVMPGLAANDFGDSIRFGANHNAEDEPDLSKVNFSLELFEAYTKGFLEIAGDALTPLEVETLPWGAKLMTLECGIRFLTDYLEGDHYFAVHRPGQNLDRARTQFKLVRDMEACWDEMNAIVCKYR
ncbi:aminoglycoside phosphotransferase family protein [uncultured Eubacterium sp.]|mgnify:FL=1|uniref:phosphotransferase enzyme family protein n=1 Tax=uncultured Eubacterium sp. TaxID=165185 RepID=UPI0025DA4003|nr:aminoglycoside phosphotransferase family protein [uncultured Eubacterium sp.]